MLKVALTHDVDRIAKTYQYVTHLYSAIAKGMWNDALYQATSVFRRNTYFNFDMLIKDEQKLGVKSTFFFLHETLKFKPFSIDNWYLSLGRYSLEEKKVKEIILWLDKNGWEVGLHGSYLSYDNYELMRFEKQLLESILNHSVAGIRQHHLQMCEETWAIQKRCKFKYDSSFGLNDKIGFKDEQYIPFAPYSDDFKVFPMIIMDNPFSELADKWAELDRIIDICINKNSLLVINWHTDHYHPKEFPGFRDNYLRIIEECKKNSGKFYTLEEYYSELTKDRS